MHSAPESTDDAPAHRSRATWSWRCPYCPHGTLSANQTGALTCGACKATLPPPRAPESPWLSDPRTQDEHGAWAGFSWHGDLEERWGTSTDRDNWTPPAKFDIADETPERTPRIREEHRRGREDQLLDGVIASYVAGTTALADTLRALRSQARRKRAAPPTRRKGHRADLAAALIAHLDETHGAAPATNATAALRTRFAPGRYRLPPLYTREHDGTLAPVLDDYRPPLPATTDAEDAACFQHWLAIAATIPAVYDALLAGAVSLAANLLIRRGVDASSTVGGEPGTGEPLALRIPRKERFSGTLHAVAIAFSQPELAPRPSAPAAPALHGLRGGMRFNEVTCHPSHGGSGRAPGVDQVIDKLDVERALSALSPRDRDLLTSTGDDPNTRRQRDIAWQRATDALRGMERPGEQGIIPPRKPRKTSASGATASPQLSPTPASIEIRL